MYVAIKPRFQNTLNKEKEDKIKLSEAETKEMKFRPIHCPYCDNHIVDVFEDIIGHFAIKCQRCKCVIPINAAYFRTSKYLAAIRKAKS